MIIQRYDLYIYKGEDYAKDVKFVVNGEPYSLVDITPKAQIRLFPNAESLVAEFYCYKDDAEGIVHMFLDSETTASIPVGKYAWDLRMIEGNQTNYFVKGDVYVEGRVTR